MSDGSKPTENPGLDPDDGGLDELRGRLDALQDSVERLGMESAPAGPPAPDCADPSATPPASAEPSVYDAQPYSEPEATYEPPAQPPAPAATNGHADAAVITAEPANLVIVDAGPFSDLIELRQFEEAVTRIEAVRDVHVRRFGHKRAQIEVGMAGHYALGLELHGLGRPLRVEPGPDGQVVVHFADAEEGEAAATEEAPALDAIERGTRSRADG